MVDTAAAQPRLLVVDDEPALLKLMGRYLSGLGYQVQSCQTAGEACRTFAAEPDAFALVLADLTMPDMSGEDMVLAMLQVRPDVRVLVCSGYPFDLSKLPAQLVGQFGYLQKPFLSKMLVEAVEALLGPSPRGL